ncbi:MAG: low molecular weight phosphotyrosine protein phosphatase [Rikenellaceae bacterium]|nr:low molecular weight phosphotyrosine protein phosphatase [Rikenellaceae bacterium]
MNTTKKYKILFVCLGNICRSPAAEGIMNKIIEERGVKNSFVTDSAGTYGGHAGEKADSRMRKTAEERGYNLSSRSRKIQSDDFNEFDIILAMDDNNYYDLQEIAPDVDSMKKIRRMTDFCSNTDATHVPDPYYGGINGFNNVLDILEDACTGLIVYLINQQN